jgi:hypothetical protein
MFAHFGVESVEMHDNVIHIRSCTVYDDSEPTDVLVIVPLSVSRRFP